MGSGAPDWYARSLVDIIAQTLARIEARLSFGPAKASSYDGICSPGTTELISLSGKGVIYGGFCTSIDTAGHQGDSVYVELDGTTMLYSTFTEMNAYQLNHPVLCMPFLHYYDETAMLYCVGFPQGWTFETSLKVYYKTIAGLPCTVKCYLYYALTP